MPLTKLSPRTGHGRLEGERPRLPGLGDQFANVSRKILQSLREFLSHWFRAASLRMITTWYLQSHCTWDRCCDTCIGSPSGPQGPSRGRAYAVWRSIARRIARSSLGPRPEAVASSRVTTWVRGRALGQSSLASGSRPIFPGCTTTGKSKTFHINGHTLLREGEPKLNPAGTAPRLAGISTGQADPSGGGS